MVRRNDATLDRGLKPRELEIVRASYRLFGDHGLHSVSLDQIAGRTGVSKGILLYYFKSRDNLILATMEWVLTATAERLRSATAAQPEAAKRIEAMVDAIWVDPETNRRFYLIYLELTGQAVRRHRYTEVSASYHRLIDGMYADTVRESGGSDPERAAPVIRAIIDGLFLQWLQEVDWRTAHADYRRRCREAVLAYLGSPAQRGP